MNEVTRMATTTGRIVPGGEYAIHDEPHIEGHRTTVQFIPAQVADRGLDPQAVANTYDLDIADVYRALTYYYDHLDEMREIEQKREQVIEDHDHLTTDPDAVRE